jgi:biopolymer transport protein ExbD
MKFQMQNKPLDTFTFSSLTDIVLQLLIFFLLTSSFVSHSGIKVELPKASKGEPPAEQLQVMISLTNTNEIYVNNTLTKEQDLKSSLIEIIKDRKNPLIVLNADKDVNLQNAIKIIDIAKSAGCTKYLLATAVADQTTENQNK